MRTFKDEVNNVNLFLCIFADGTRVFQFTTGTNNQVTFCSWIFDLVRFLDRTRPKWRSSHCLVMDNCSAHRTELSMKVLRHLRVPVAYTAPASMTAMPVERVFGLLKSQVLSLPATEAKR